MKVKILQAKDNYWYVDRIGTIFEPVGEADTPKGRAYIIELGTIFEEENRRVILKSDCRVIIEHKETDDKKHFDWRMRCNSQPGEKQYKERSALNTQKEIEFYEKLNEEAVVKTYNIRDKKEYL